MLIVQRLLQRRSRLYVDAVAITSVVGDLRYEKCLKLINIMAGADVMKELSVCDSGTVLLSHLVGTIEFGGR